jgi:hypothetical protein
MSRITRNRITTEKPAVSICYILLGMCILSSAATVYD